jgi:hypothetical protein
VYNISVMEGKSRMISSLDRCSKIFSIVMQAGTDVTPSNSGSGSTRSNVVDKCEQLIGSSVMSADRVAFAVANEILING